MTREFIIKELRNRSIKAEATEVTKNGITFEGIMLEEGSVRPIIYKDSYKDVIESNIDDFVSKVEEILAESSQFVLEDLTNWDWVKTRLRLCIQQQGDEDICKRNFLDLEQYVRVMVDEGQGASFKVKPRMLEKYGVSEDTLFHAAIDCTRPLVDIKDMTSIIAEMANISINEVREMQGENPPMFVVTNKTNINGASAICFTDVLRKISDMYKSDLVIFPSSVHECILYPVEDITNFRDFDKMISDINATEVTPEDILSNHAYRFIRDKNRIVY